MNALPGSSVGILDVYRPGEHPAVRFIPQPAETPRVLVRPDRRNGETRAALVSRIAGEYREMPGLALTLAQAARLFGLGPATCWRVLDDCIRAGWLCCTPAGVFKLAKPEP